RRRGRLRLPAKQKPSRREPTNTFLCPPYCPYRFSLPQPKRPSMELWNFLAGGAALGLIAGFWDKIKAVAWKAANLFIQQVEVPSEPAHNALVSHLVGRFQRSRLYDRMYGAWYEHSRDGKYGLVAYEQFGFRSVIFWDGWRPFLFSNAQENKA